MQDLLHQPIDASIEAILAQNNIHANRKIARLAELLYEYERQTGTIDLLNRELQFMRF